MDSGRVSLRIAPTGGLRYAKLTSSLIFDTHTADSRYRSAGFTDAQVEALVEVARETTALPDVSSLATKADLKSDIGQMAELLDGKIDRVQAELRAAIASSQVQTVTLVLAGMAAMVAFSSVLPKLVR
jgi:hypothetical protein